MLLTIGTLTLLWRVLCVAMFVLVLTELSWAQDRDGEALRRLRGVLAAMVFVVLFPTVASIDMYTDVSPYFSFRVVLSDWVWIAYATLFTCLLRFWFSLHQWVKRKRKGE